MYVAGCAVNSLIKFSQLKNILKDIVLVARSACKLIVCFRMHLRTSSARTRTQNKKEETQKKMKRHCFALPVLLKGRVRLCEIHLKHPQKLNSSLTDISYSKLVFHKNYIKVSGAQMHSTCMQCKTNLPCNNNIQQLLNVRERF